MRLPIVKTHAYGNDFLLAREEDAAPFDAAGLARLVCERHTGIGADGLILYRPSSLGATMRLFNADGSFAEVSGNGVRCLATLLMQDRPQPEKGTALTIETDGGTKRLWFLDVDGTRYQFRAEMGPPEAIQQVDLDLGAITVRATTLRVGNPQCVVLERELDERRLLSLGPLIAQHSRFPAGTNVEFAKVARPDRVEILIWERGVGPTRASGTGACAAAVAAASHGNASRSVDVVAPGGAQHVEWQDDGLYLTGWAEVVLKGTWCGPSMKPSGR
ncbi:MAG: diaminopimelate epimerase [Acidobacteria bacterium]|nr:diaminopimelate epimerase [Acidobacteriota bacterium]